MLITLLTCVLCVERVLSPCEALFGTLSVLHSIAASSRMPRSINGVAVIGNHHLSITLLTCVRCAEHV